MFIKLFRSIVSLIATAALLNAVGSGPARTEDSSVGSAVGNLVGGIVGSVLGLSYKQTPEFRRYVAPYIKNMAAFDGFMEKYNYKNVLSEKDSIDMIIKLGIPLYKPEWLNNDAIQVLNKYYPDVIKKKASSDQNSYMVAELCNRFVVADYNNCSYQEANEVVIGMMVIFAAGYGLAMIANLSLNGMNRSNFMKWVKPEIQQAEDASENQMCSSSGACSPVDKPKTPPDTKIWRPSNSSSGTCICRCRAGDPTKPATFRFAEWTAPTCPEAAIQACSVASNRAAVSNQHHVQAKCSDGGNYNMGGTLAR